MLLKVIASGSKGNSYILEENDEALIIECGKPLAEIKIALGFNVRKMKGCLVSHIHKDHSQYKGHFKKLGIPVYEPYENLVEFESVKMGNFNVTTIPLNHDVPCYGFLIHHPNMGNLLYASDTSYIKYRFSNLNHILVEANYSKELLQLYEPEAKDHILEGHMCIDTTCRFLKQNNNEHLQNVVLLHMSQDNGDAEEFINKASKVVDCPVYMATPGLVVELGESK